MFVWKPRKNTDIDIVCNDTGTTLTLSFIFNKKGNKFKVLFRDELRKFTYLIRKHQTSHSNNGDESNG